jgi:large subunit ribosomal protein L18
MNKVTARVRRGKATRIKIKNHGKVRLCIHRTPRHIYAQVISGEGDKVIAAASTVEKTVRDEMDYTGNVKAADVIGKLIAERAIEKGITEVAFDRAGFRYHGRVKALADAARKHGLKF